MSTDTTPALALLRDSFDSAGLPALGAVTFDLAIESVASVRVRVADGSVRFDEARSDPAESAVKPDFRFSIGADDWARFISEPPPRGYTSAQAMRASLGWSSVEGDVHRWGQYAPVIDRVFEILRGAQAPRPDRNHDPKPLSGTSPIVGGYLGLDVDGQRERIYYEASGDGPIPVLCLHTAGADSRQFRYLLEDEELTRAFRFVAFDLPWHGRSDPPATWQTESYRLTTARYAALIRAVARNLGLDRPVLLGCSMGGAIALYMAAVHGEEFRASLSLEGGLGNPNRFVPWTNHLEVDHSHFLTSWVGGLMAPSSPSASRAQTLWGYAQSGPGVYQGDTYFYSEDFPAIGAGLGRSQCPLWVFNGEYDYSATAEMSREAAEKLGATYVEMPRFGHFPMSEDPAVFRGYLVPVLDEIKRSSPDGH